MIILGTDPNGHSGDGHRFTQLLLFAVVFCKPERHISSNRPAGLGLFKYIYIYMLISLQMYVGIVSCNVRQGAYPP